jgi:hypothetical protein
MTVETLQTRAGFGMQNVDDACFAACNHQTRATSQPLQPRGIHRVEFIVLVSVLAYNLALCNVHNIERCANTTRDHLITLE